MTDLEHRSALEEYVRTLSLEAEVPNGLLTLGPTSADAFGEWMDAFEAKLLRNMPW